MSALTDELPLQCKAADGVLGMRVGVKILANAVRYCPDLWDGEDDRPSYRVTDPAAFAEAVAAEINREGEDGSTLLTRMIDAACLEAIERGTPGVEEHEVSKWQQASKRAPSAGCCPATRG